jgi:hypothetical protein
MIPETKGKSLADILRQQSGHPSDETCRFRYENMLSEVSGNKIHT